MDLITSIVGLVLALAIASVAAAAVLPYLQRHANERGTTIRAFLASLLKRDKSEGPVTSAPFNAAYNNFMQSTVVVFPGGKRIPMHEVEILVAPEDFEYIERVGAGLLAEGLASYRAKFSQNEHWDDPRPGLQPPVITFTVSADVPRLRPTVGNYKLPSVGSRSSRERSAQGDIITEGSFSSADAETTTPFLPPDDTNSDPSDRTFTMTAAMPDEHGFWISYGGQERPFGEASTPIRIGRRPHCDIVISDETVSGVAAEITHDAGVWYLLLLQNKKNASFLDGIKIAEPGPHRLRDGAVLKLAAASDISFTTITNGDRD
ncbi:FHA domain-containing protein [Pseudoclavibacter helvolus]|uniref:FHA domain-containing protein n=1 Tax=Pseudoclavibacter helvolus TaxID=255205 RepID=UPI000837D268|nr:FHA domain-containing protein [Pseudoclavibacter helvolus]